MNRLFILTAAFCLLSSSRGFVLLQTQNKQQHGSLSAPLPSLLKLCSMAGGDYDLLQSRIEEMRGEFLLLDRRPKQLSAEQFCVSLVEAIQWDAGFRPLMDCSTPLFKKKLYALVNAPTMDSPDEVAEALLLQNSNYSEGESESESSNNNPLCILATSDEWVEIDVLEKLPISNLAVQIKCRLQQEGAQFTGISFSVRKVNDVWMVDSMDMLHVDSSGGYPKSNP